MSMDMSLAMVDCPAFSWLGSISQNNAQLYYIARRYQGTWKRAGRLKKFNTSFFFTVMVYAKQCSDPQ